MTCETYREYMMKYLDGEASDSENKTLNEHMRVCGNCAGLYSQLAGLFEEIDNIEEKSPPADFNINVMKRVRTVEKARRERASGMIILAFNALMAIAITLTLIFGSGALVSVQYAFDLIWSSVKSLAAFAAEIINAVFTLNAMVTKLLYISVIAAAALMLALHRAFIQLPRIRADKLSGALTEGYAGNGRKDGIA
jgi:predicted anti-sigma-YlaC factor YlaD